MLMRYAFGIFQWWYAIHARHTSTPWENELSIGMLSRWCCKEAVVSQARIITIFRYFHLNIPKGLRSLLYCSPILFVNHLRSGSKKEKNYLYESNSLLVGDWTWFRPVWRTCIYYMYRRHGKPIQSGISSHFLPFVPQCVFSSRFAPEKQTIRRYANTMHVGQRMKEYHLVFSSSVRGCSRARASDSMVWKSCESVADSVEAGSRAGTRASEVWIRLNYKRILQLLMFIVYDFVFFGGTRQRPGVRVYTRSRPYGILTTDYTHWHRQTD